jgi:serine/threonine-protein phosphatase 2B regulatory subunit
MGNQSSNQGMNFTKNELKILYKNFIKLDTDKSGLIEPNEFFDVPELKENPIVQRVISVFDKNNDGKISFYEFVLGLSALTDNGIFN